MIVDMRSLHHMLSMRMFSAGMVGLSFLLVLPSAAAAMVAPFGLETGVPFLRMFLSAMLILGPFLLLFAGIYGAVLLRDNRRMTKTPLVAFVSAICANALFWLGV